MRSGFQKSLTALQTLKSCEPGRLKNKVWSNKDGFESTAANTGFAPVLVLG